MDYNFLLNMNYAEVHNYLHNIDYEVDIGLIKVLMKHKDPEVRSVAVEVPVCAPVEVLGYLSKDTDRWVRSAVAGNDNTPLHILEELSKDKCVVVRSYVSGNVNASQALIEKIYKRESFYLHNAIGVFLRKVKKEIYSIFDRRYDQFMIEYMLSNDNCPSHILEEFYLKKKKTNYNFWSLAYNSNTPFYILEELHLDRRYYYALSQNPSCGLGVLLKIIDLKEEYVAEEPLDDFFPELQGEEYIEINPADMDPVDFLTAEAINFDENELIPYHPPLTARSCTINYQALDSVVKLINKKRVFL